MKKYIWISIIFLLSCGGRKSTVDIQKEDKRENITLTAAEKTVVKSDNTKIVEIETSTGSSISEKKTEAEKKESATEASSEKRRTENSGKSLKRKTYFENGSIKSETDYTENFSKIESENENLKSKIFSQTESITDLRSANTSLQRIVENQKLSIAAERSKNSKLLSEKSELSKIKNKKTERQAYPWYWIVIGSILIWELIKLASKKYGGNFLERLNRLR